MVFIETARIFGTGRESGRISPESGMTLVETLVLLAIVGTITVTFLSGLFIMSKANSIADRQTTAQSLVQSQMEGTKGRSYVYDATGYPPLPFPSDGDYSQYSATINAEPLQNPDSGIQKVTVTIKYSDKEVIRLEDYKVDR